MAFRIAVDSKKVPPISPIATQNKIDFKNAEFTSGACLSAQIYRQILQEISDRLGIPNNHSSESVANFSVNGITCSMDYSKENSSVILACDFGEPIPRTRADALSRLMELNLELINAGQSRFCSIPSTGRISFITVFPLTHDKVYDIFGAMTDLVNYAKNWRVANFVDDPGFSALSAPVTSLPNEPMHRSLAALFRPLRNSNTSEKS